MSTFFPARGCVYQVLDTGNQSSGFYKFGSLGGQGLQGNSAVLIQGVDFQESDIVSQVTTLANTKILYTFGEAFGSVGVRGEILMGPAGGSQQVPAWQQVYDFFQNYRVAVYQKPVELSMPNSKILAVYLQGLSIGAIDPEFHVQPFLFSCIIADNGNS